MDPYSTLGIRRGASEQEAKEAFRKLAKTCHPDLHPGDAQAEQRFKEINSAYDAIRNPQPEPHVNMSWQFHGSPFSGGMPFEEMFSDIFGQRRNRDHVIEYCLTLEEAFHGKEVMVSVPTGSKTPRTIKVTIPAGIAHGMRIRVPQGGYQTNPSMIAGDLYLAITVSAHQRFTRAGPHLTTTVPVNVFDVLLCKEIDVVGIDGKTLRAKIPAGYDSSRLRISGQGMPDPYTGTRGDLLVELFVIYPALTDEQQTLIRQAVLPKDK